MNIILHDLSSHLTFAPLTLTRPVGNLRTGMFTNDERWKFYVPEAEVSFMTKEYLSHKYPAKIKEDNYWINATIIPTIELVKRVKDLQVNESLYIQDTFVAYRGGEYKPQKPKAKTEGKIIVLKNRWDLYQMNELILTRDFQAYTAGKTSQPLSDTNTLIGDKSRLFIEEGAKVEAAVLNVNEGPIYIGKNAEIMEGTVVRGPLAMAEHSALKLSAKVYGATSLGPHCKVGGEVNNVVFQAYSNKGHDGFIGNAVIGEWCNLGADTNCSNLKNNYGNVRTYDYFSHGMVDTDVQFMGVVMGDFSKTSINTMLNTATVVGVCANIFTEGFPPKFVPNFSWGGHGAEPIYDLGKAFDSADAMMARRGLKLTDEEKSILTYLHP